MNPSLAPLLLAAGLMLGAVLAPETAAEEADPAPAARVAVGQVAPAIALPDMAGVEHRSADLRGEKNLVAVFFRGAW